MYKGDGFKLEVFDDLGNGPMKLDISDFVQGLTWKSSMAQAAVMLNVELVDIEALDTVSSLVVGSKIRLAYESQELVRGIVTNITRNINGSLSIIALDNMYYLTKNMTSYNAENVPGHQIIMDVLGAFSVPVENVPDIQVPIKQVFRDMTLWNIIQAVFKEDKKVTGDDWLVRLESNRLRFVKLGPDRPKWKLDSARLRLSGSSAMSMENLYTTFVVRGEKDQIINESANRALIDKYGQMVYQVTDEEADLEKSKQMIEALKSTRSGLDESLSLECLGNHEMKCGDRILIQDEALKVNGLYESLSISHSHAGGLYKMQLQLRRCLDEG